MSLSGPDLRTPSTFEEDSTEGAATRSRAVSLPSYGPATAGLRSGTPQIFELPGEYDFSGRTLERRYSLVRKIGAGSFATVYLAHDLRMFGRKVAIKVLHPERGRNPVNVERFVQEMKVAAKLDGPYRDRVVKIIDHGSCEADPPLLYLVMEYVDGIALNTLLGNMKGGARRRRPMPWTQSTSVILELVKALATLHACGVVHRDIKPGNVIIEQKPDGDVLKLLDLGIAKVLPGHEISSNGPRTHPEFVLGTPRYMAPEQFAGACKDARVDLYAAGIMLYEFLTGDVPSKWFERPGAAHPYMPIPPSQANPGAGIPATLDAVTLKAIAFNPDDRYQTADELALALAEIVLEAERQAARARALAEVSQDGGARGRGLRAAFAVGDLDARGWVALRWWVTITSACAAMCFVVAMAAAMRRPRMNEVPLLDEALLQALQPRPARPPTKRAAAAPPAEVKRAPPQPEPASRTESAETTVPASNPATSPTTETSRTTTAPTTAPPKDRPVPEPTREPPKVQPKKESDEPPKARQRSKEADDAPPPILSATVQGVLDGARRTLQARCPGVKGSTMVEINVNVATARQEGIHVPATAAPQLRKCILYHASSAFQFAGLARREPSYSFIVDL